MKNLKNKMERKEKEYVEKELASILSTTLQLEDELNLVISRKYVD
jgi:hypothetical protein